MLMMMLEYIHPTKQKRTHFLYTSQVTSYSILLFNKLESQINIFTRQYFRILGSFFPSKNTYINIDYLVNCSPSKTMDLR